MSQTAEIDGKGNIIVQIEGDQNQVNVKGLPYLTLTRYLTRRGGESEAEILTPYSFSIPMIGRDDEMAKLDAWLDGPKPISVRVLTGRAGAGKTRLALEMIEVRLTSGWDAGIATSRELQRFFAQQNLKAWGWQRPTLVVIDYASSHAEAIYDWLAELSDHGGIDGKPLRLLLLERSANEDAGWWRTAFGYSDGTAKAIQRLLDPAKPVALSRIEEQERKREIFQAALSKGGKTLRAPDAGEDTYFDQRLADLTWGGEPLFLMMAGLLGAKHGLNKVLALSRIDLAFDLADRELERIGRAGGKTPSRTALLRHMAVFVTLCGGLSQKVLEDAIEGEREATKRESAGDAATLANLLIDILPGAPGEAAPILPDMIGEAACLLVLDNDADTVLRAFEMERVQVPAATIRTAQDFASQERGGNKIVAPLAWLDGLVSIDAIEGQALEQLGWQLIDVFRASGTSVVLARHAETVSSKVCQSLAGDTDGEVAAYKYATWLVIHGVTLGALGRREEALTADERAAEIYHQLARVRPDAFLPGLATSLNNLANRLSDLGRREDALETAKEAVQIRRRLVSERPDAFLPDLSGSLNNLAALQSALGRREDALTTAEEAIQIRRRLASERPDAFFPDLAMSLNTLSACLAAAGKKEEALRATEESVATRRKLAEERPDAFSHQLAISLFNLSIDFDEFDQRAEALQSNPKQYQSLSEAFSSIHQASSIG
ncbi:MAG: tetratricopeptide repeat protein [Alphaproteobacteria bacterium]|nr:tetratricopeptide repeat protein [Alphaproteobacteria bacterium]